MKKLFLTGNLFRLSVLRNNFISDNTFFKDVVCQRKMFSSANNEQKFGVDGVDINYLKVGHGSKCVLCLPGSIWSDFKPQIEHFDKSKLTVVVWDPPGYGKSRPPDRDFSSGFFQKDADFAARLMKVLNFEKYSLLGWSDGGITAMILAAKYPKEVDKLIVWGANALVTVDDIKIYQGIRDISKWSEKMRAPLVALYGEDYFKRTWEAWVDAFVDIYEKNGGDLCCSALPNIKCPTLVIHGAKDPMVPEEHPKYLIEQIKNCRYHVFEQGKHNLHLRFPEEFNRIVQEFITS
ncbi:serine hydrolase BPHL-like isoform X2 [Lycorma delicatula]|uniref:serine hydrolase BPHL-like isoform X2 n=1 Tax=Lycorma delicatula TaxID=130591 RepID=UPI003F5114D8